MQTQRAWTHELRLIAGGLDSLCERIARLERRIVEYFKAHPCLPSSADDHILPTGEPFVSYVDVDRRADGSAEIAMDGGRRFKLAPQLAEFFLFLASGERNPESKDPLVGWRSRAQIRDCLSRWSGRELPPRFVNNLVHRLKVELDRAGYDSLLIQTHRRMGVRLACRAASAAQANPFNR